MSAHTAGPWIAREWSRHAPTTICHDVDGHMHVIAEVSGYGTEAAVLANAQLIAAAPDLLALAKQYASECGECDGTGTVLDRDTNMGGPCPDCAGIRGVIAKAEGQP